MRRPLLILLALIVLLTQPAGLLHALSHGSAAVEGRGAAASAPGPLPESDHAHGPSGLDCLQCLAFAAIGGAALPGTAPAWCGPPLRQAPPMAGAAGLCGGTGAGYHARGPPHLA
jgi:hypothetical protein